MCSNYTHFRMGAVTYPYKRPRLETSQILQSAQPRNTVNDSAEQLRTTHPLLREEQEQPHASDQPPSKRTRMAASTTGGISSADLYKKYSSNCSSTLLANLSKHFGTGPATLLSAAYTQQTWKAYEAAYNSFRAFETYSNSTHPWPLTQNTINAYIAWAALVKHLRMTTITTYVASITSIHRLLGHEINISASFITKVMLRGAEHIQTETQPAKTTRKVFTLALLKILGHQIATSNWTEDSKRIYWTCSCVAFFGSCRMGELLAPHEQHYDSMATLLWKDIKIQDNHCILHIKSPKSNHTEGEFVDLFTFPQHSCCPVSCITALKKHTQTSDSSPVFRFASGTLLTKSKYNTVLRTLLKPVLGDSACEYSSHSLRAAVPSALDRHPGLTSDKDIQGWGRWQSSCYTKYTRLKNEQKRAIYTKICNALIL